MPKLPECDQCQLYSLTPHLVCAIHPSGPATDECWDFAPKAAAMITTEAEDLWFPGAASYGGELIPESHSRLTQEEQLELLETHPLFTGRCPQCRHELKELNHPSFEWQCDHCGWSDPA